MKVNVILPAAGLGRRFDPSRPPQGEGNAKLDQRLGGQPVFLHAVEAFAHRPEVSKVLLAVRPDALGEFRFKWAQRLAMSEVEILAGGRAERWQTVARALDHVEADVTHVAVHDAARPLVNRALIDRVFQTASNHAAVIPATPAANTLKRVRTVDRERNPRADGGAGGGEGAKDRAQEILSLDPDPPAAQPHEPGDAPTVQQVVETVSRTNLVQVQTPQVFTLELIRRAYALIDQGKVDPATITDDAGLVEALNEPVYVVEGQRTNLKITHQTDLDLAAALVSQWQAAAAKTHAAKRLFAEDEQE